VKKIKLPLPDDIDNSDRISTFEEGTALAAREAIGKEQPTKNIIDLIEKTRDLVDSSYACGYVDAVQNIWLLVRQYAESFEAKFSGIQLADLEKHIEAELDYPQPTGMNKEFKFLRPFVYGGDNET
jgi:hypothetical protein